MLRWTLRAGAILTMTLLAGIAGADTTAKRPLPPAKVCIGSACVTSATGSGPIKWNPGHYMASNSVIFKGQTISRIQAEMDDLNGWDKILGHRVWITWSALEPEQGKYDFTVLDSILQRLKTHYDKPKRLVIVVMPGTFASKMGSSDAGTLPLYLQTNSAYGPSPVAGKYGWWGVNANGASTGNYSAALYRPAVMDRFIALINALGAHYDSDPYVEAFMIQEISWVIGTWKGSDYSEAAFLPQLRRMLTAATDAFPHTNVVLQNTWLTTQQPTLDLEAWMVANRVAPGSADVLGKSAFPDSTLNRLPWGLAAFAGVKQSSGGPADLRSQMHSLVDVEAPDICGPRPIPGGPYSPTDIIAALNTVYGASHAFWTHLSGKENWGCPTAANWPSLAPTLSANPLTNTSYPASYPQK